MRYIGEIDFYDDINGKLCVIYVEEYATIWSISARHFGWALCSLQDWRYPKKQFKTVYDAVEQFKRDAGERLK